MNNEMEYITAQRQFQLFLQYLIDIEAHLFAAGFFSILFEFGWETLTM